MRRVLRSLRGDGPFATRADHGTDPGDASGLADAKARVRREFHAASQAGALHGMVVAAGNADRLRVLWAAGSASVQPFRRRMRTGAIFDVASLTKVVASAAACGVCIDRGWLDPLAPITDYLPNAGRFPGVPIRVCDLATHCSGYDNRKFDGYPPGQLIERAVREPAQWPARERYEYSCRNFILLGAIVERITGQSLAGFCASELFAPLGMRDTGFGLPRRQRARGVPTSQPAGTVSDEQARAAGRPIGNAGIFSTARDLARFCQMLLRGGTVGPRTVLAAPSLAWLLRPTSPQGLPRRSFGWDMRDPADCHHRPRGLSMRAIGHAGWTGQSLWVDPGRGLFVIVLTNRTHCPGNPNNTEASRRMRARIGEALIGCMAPAPRPESALNRTTRLPDRTRGSGC